MNRPDQILIGLIGAATVALVWIVAGTLAQHATNPGDKAPDFNLVTDKGDSISPSQFEGKLLVLNFWATWCGGCVQEIKSLDTFERTFANRGVVVLGISMDANESLYKSFLRRFRIGFATARDPSWDICASYGTFQLPETYVIDRTGTVVEKLVAAHDFMDPDFLRRMQGRLN